MTEKFGRSRYGGLSLGRGWYLQMLRENNGIALTTGKASQIAICWKHVTLGYPLGITVLSSSRNEGWRFWPWKIAYYFFWPLNKALSYLQK